MEQAQVSAAAAQGSVRSESPIAAEAVAAWRSLQVEAAVGPEEAGSGLVPADALVPDTGVLSQTAGRMGYGADHLQRVPTRQVEDARAGRLEQRMALLPAGSTVREAYYEADAFTRRWVDACPVPKHVCDNVQFIDLTVDFFGLPARPRCAPHQHKPVPGALGKVVG